LTSSLIQTTALPQLRVLLIDEAIAVVIQAITDFKLLMFSLTDAGPSPL